MGRLLAVAYTSVIVVNLEGHAGEDSTEDTWRSTGRQSLPLPVSHINLVGQLSVGVGFSVVSFFCLAINKYLRRRLYQRLKSRMKRSRGCILVQFSSVP